MNKWRLLKILNMLVLVKDQTSKGITSVPLAIHPLKKNNEKKAFVWMVYWQRLIWYISGFLYLDWFRSNSDNVFKENNIGYG